MIIYDDFRRKKDTYTHDQLSRKWRQTNLRLVRGVLMERWSEPDFRSKITFLIYIVHKIFQEFFPRSP